MGFGRALRALGAVSLVAVVTVGGAATARADQARDGQWVLAEYQARQAIWPLSTGKGVVVAVIDSGVRATHVDLRGQVLPGKDFADGGDGWTDRSAEGHGTGMASVIAGHGHGPGGADGVMGLAPGAKILPVGIGTGIGGNGLDYVPQAIRYAVDHGARVISMSVGSPSANPAEEAAVAYAERHDVVLVAAAGNDGSSRAQYPASWPGVVKVSAVDENGKLWKGSTTGGVTVAAPGVHIVRDGADSDTEVVSASGSSDAAAYVAALAALLRSEHPDLTAGQTVAQVIATAIPPPGHQAHDPAFGYGIMHPSLSRPVEPGPAAGPLPQATVPPGTTLDGNGDGEQTAAGPFDVDPGVLYGGLAVLGLLAALVVLRQVVRRRTIAALPDAAPPLPAGDGQPARTQDVLPEAVLPEAVLPQDAAT